MNQPPEVVTVPLRYPLSTIYLDESGARIRSGELFVIAGIKVRRNGDLMRAVRHIRDQTGFRHELKFSGINNGSLPAYYEIVNLLEASDAHIVGSVTHGRLHKKLPQWRHHVAISAQLIRGAIHPRELTSVYVDAISTPVGVAYEDVLRGTVNNKIGATAVVSAACLDSKSSDGLQIADLVASAISYDRRMTDGADGVMGTPKARVVARLREAFGVADFSDQRTARLNIKSFSAPKPRNTSDTLDVVPGVGVA